MRLRLLPYDDWVQLMLSMSRMLLLTLIHLKENHGRHGNVDSTLGPRVAQL